KTKLEEAQQTLRKKENLLKILSAMANGTDEDIYLNEKNTDGTWKTKKLSAFTNLEINNYSGDNLRQSVKDSSGNDTFEPLDINKGKTKDGTGADYVITGTALELLRSAAKGNAKKFLDDIVAKPPARIP